jgi:hypothetical protein
MHPHRPIWDTRVELTVYGQQQVVEWRSIHYPKETNN